MSNGAYYANPNPFSNYPIAGTAYTTSTNDTALNQLLSQLYQQNMVQQVHQRLNKHAYIASNKLYINGLDVVRLV